MRPIYLKMKAFGSYAKETEVKFDELGNNLYLITGDTGAGKTTIFDAIVFALYGTASGQKRDVKKMHSDFVGRDVPTEVFLRFEHDGKIHEVERKITFSKKRATGEYDEEGKISAIYREADKDVIEVASKVTDRIEEQLGLTADQFRKIVMLAQGDFRRFLDSDSDQRADILRQLFDFEIYTKFQTWMNKASNSLSGTRAAAVDKRKTIMGTFAMPETITDEEMALYSANHPHLVQNLAELIAQDEKLLGAAEEAKKEADDTKRRIHNELELAKNNNKNLKKLADAQQIAEQLENKKPEIDSLNEQIEKAEAALRNVSGFENDLRTKENALATLKDSISKLSELKAHQKVALKIAEENADELHKSDKVITQLGHDIQNLTESLPKYEKLDDDKKRLKKAQDESSAHQEKIASANDKKEKADVAIKANNEKLELLADVEVQAANAAAACKEAVDHLEELVGEEGITGVVREISNEETDLANAKAALLTLTDKAVEATERYHTAYKAFVQNQAGIMAADLTAEITENGQGTCPVCGTIHTTVPETGFATSSDVIYTQDDVNAAKESAEKAENKRSEQYTFTESKKAGLIQKKDAVEKRAARLFETAITWEMLTQEGFLESKVEAFKEKKACADHTYKELKNKVSEKQERNNDNECLVKTAEEAEKIIIDNQERCQELSNTIAALKAAIEEQKAGLVFENKEAAAADIQKKASEKAKREAAIKQADKALDLAKTNYNQTSGSLENEQKKVPDTEALVKTARETFAKAITENGFSDYEEYRAALPADGEKWIKDQSESIAAYKTDCIANAAEIKTLEEQTKDCERVDLEGLQQKLGEAEVRFEELDAQYNQLFSTCESHKKTKNEVEDIQAELAQTDAASRRLETLSNVAVGVNSSEGKFSFERYAMGASFREILEAANERLQIMSNGRYELRHVISGKTKASQSGLGIVVYDNYTGKQREANSISGGESFQVSMSLALGLSDIVQRHAGGRTIDSMFIDEGFGSLSNQALDQAVRALEDLSGNNKQIGIISHVARLEECIGKKLVVTSDEKNGSKIAQV